MRIALLSYEYPPETGFGGIGTYTWYQARALVRLGHEVRVVAGSLQPGVFHDEREGVKITRVLDSGWLDGAIRGLNDSGQAWAANRLRTASGAYRALVDLLEHESYDVVEYPECGADGMVVATMLPVRTAVRFHSPARFIMASYGANGPDVDATTFLEQIAIERAQVRISPSKFLASAVIERLSVEPPVHVVPNGIDLALFDQSGGVDVVQRFGLPPEGKAVTVLVTGRLERRKGSHLLPGVCSKILRDRPHVHVVVAGDDPLSAMGSSVLPRLAADGVVDRFHHLGPLSLPEVRALLKYAQIHLHPSLWDNAPYSCIEAMAAGLPVVSSDVGGLPELVEHRGTGLVVPADDEDSFVEALTELIDDAALRERLGAAARRAVEDRFTDVAMARRSVVIWQDLIGSSA